MMNALFLEKHTAGDRIDLPAIVNTSAVHDSQYSHCTINGNNTVWTAGTDVVFLNNGEDTVWQGTLPQGHTFLYRNGKNVLRSRWPENGYLHCDKWEKQWDEEKKIFTTNRLHLSIPEEVRRELTGATAVLYFDWLNIRFSVTDTTETYVDLQKVSKYKFGSDCCKVCFENVSVKYLTPGKWLPVPDGGFVTSKSDALPMQITGSFVSKYTDFYYMVQNMKKEYIRGGCKNKELKKIYMDYYALSIKELFSDYALYPMSDWTGNYLKNYDREQLIKRRSNNYDYLYKGLSELDWIEVAVKREEAGLTDLLDLLDVERTLLQAEMDFVSAKQAQLNAIIDICKALGGGWTEQDGFKK